MLQHIQLLIFDLDYLIFDCSPLKWQALRRSLLANADFIPQNIRLPDSIDAEEGFREHGFRWTEFLEVGLDDEQMSQFPDAYRIHENRVLGEGVGRVFDGLREILEDWRRQEVRLALGAESTREYLLSVSDRHRLDLLFHMALCTEDFGFAAQEEMLEEIMYRNLVNRSETVVLGTRPTLFQAAHNLDLLCIGCGWGIHRHEGMAEADLQSLTLTSLNSTIRKADHLRMTSDE